MKKVSSIVIITLFIFGFFQGYLWLDTKNIAVADWEPKIELSTDIGTENQSWPNVAVDNGKVHAVWVDFGDGDGDIYYRLSTDEGVKWQPEKDISDDIGTEEHGWTSIAVEGDKVHVVWNKILDPSNPKGDTDIFYRYFDGTLWHPKEEISIDVFVDERQEQPMIAVEGDMVHVVWETYAGESTPTPFDGDVIYRRFNGISWEPPIEIGTDVVPNVPQQNPDIAAENGRVHVVWEDARDGGETDIYYRYFDGTFWQPEQEISFDFGVGTVIQIDPKITAENGQVYVLWNEWDTVVDDIDVFYRHFNGIVWEGVEEISIDPSGTDGQARGAIAVENGKVHVVYRHWDKSNSFDGDIYYRFSDGIIWLPVVEISSDSGSEGQDDPDIAVQNGIVHVVWQEGGWQKNGSWEDYDIYYRRYVPPTLDLQITSNDIVFDPGSSVGNGTSVKINATVHNVGTIDIGNIKVSFYNGDPTLGGTLIGVNQTIPFLIAGENYTVNITWLPSSPGIYDIYVAVDYPPPGKIMEANETNNIASKSLEVFDLLPPTLYIKALGDDIILNWSQPRTIGLSHYLLYRSKSQIDFDFNTIWVNTSSDHESGEPGPMPLRTVWNDTNAASPSNNTNYEEQYYYTIRAVNIFGEVSGTSRTVGKWTKTFLQGISTFSLPLEPLGTRTTDYYLTNMKASYIKWMNQTTHTWMKHGDGGVNDTQMKKGEGYEVKFDNQTNYTFTGMPGAMICYDDDTGFLGFDPSTEAKNLTVSVEPNGNVTLTWEEPAGMNSGDWYEVYYSNTRDGFFGTFNVSYFLVCPPVYFGNNTTTHNGALANNPGTRLYYMVVPFNASGIRGASTYSIGIWTEEFLSQYDTIGIPLKLSADHTADWYCDNIIGTVGINYYDVASQRWCWHSTRMPAGAYDPLLVMTEGYQISTSGPTKFTFIGI